MAFNLSVCCSTSSAKRSRYRFNSSFARSCSVRSVAKPISPTALPAWSLNTAISISVGNGVPFLRTCSIGPASWPLRLASFMKGITSVFICSSVWNALICLPINSSLVSYLCIAAQASLTNRTAPLRSTTTIPSLARSAITVRCRSFCSTCLCATIMSSISSFILRKRRNVNIQ